MILREMEVDVSAVQTPEMEDWNSYLDPVSLVDLLETVSGDPWLPNTLNLLIRILMLEIHVDLLSHAVENRTQKQIWPS